MRFGTPLCAFLAILLLPAVTMAQFNYVTNSDNTITITDYTGYGFTVIIPDTITGLPVTCIGTNAFTLASMIDLTISSNLANIGDYAFKGCSEMTNISIPAAVTNIGAYAFYGCSSMTNLIIPGNVASLGSNAFEFCSGLTNILISNGLTVIPSSAFVNCDNITHATIPNGVMSIGPNAFGGCANLKGFTIPNGVTNIGEGAFASCTSIGLVGIPSNVTYIGAQAFRACSSLNQIGVDPQNSNYSDNAGVLFDKSQSMLIQFPGEWVGGGYYSIPNGVVNIEDYAFANTSPHLTNVIISASVTNIGNYAFDQCLALTNVTIGKGVMNIGQYAFFDCHNLTFITIPASVTNLGSNAFASCSDLNHIYFLGNAPGADPTVFTNSGEFGATVYYMPRTTGWKSTFEGCNTVLWNAAIQTTDGSFGVQSNGFGFNITGPTASSVVVEVCTNLAKPVWTPVQTVTLNPNSFYFSEPLQTNVSARFYGLAVP
jgi:hypothetical protein